MNQKASDKICLKIKNFICESDHESVCESIELIKDDIYHEGLYNGWSSNTIQAGLVLSACRFENLPVTPQDISDEFDVPIRKLILSYRHICRNIDYLSVLPTKWTAFLEEYARTFELDEETVSRAFDIGQTGEINGLISGRKPRSYAASCIYAAVKIDINSRDSWITQRQLAEESNTSESSIRSTYKVLLDDYEDSDD